MESSPLEYVEENQVFATDNLENVGEKEETLVESSGACRVGDLVDEKLSAGTKSEGVNGTESVESVNSVKPKVQLSVGSSIGSLPQAIKGCGLKKWRRIRREANKEGGGNVDSSKIGKWGSSNSNQNRRNPMRLSAEEVEEEEKSEESSVSSTNVVVKSLDIVAGSYDSGSEVGPVFAARTDSSQKRRNPMCLSAEKEQKSEEGSVSSTNAVVKSLGIVAGGYDSGSKVGPVFAGGTDSEDSEDKSSKSSTAASATRSRHEIPVVGGYVAENNTMRSGNFFGGRPLFAVGTDSENSEDRSSMSSTAASAPRWTHEIHVVAGYEEENNTIRSGKYFGKSMAQQGQQEKSRVEACKKPREQQQIEKKNSHSSMDSDSRSSNSVFMQGANSMTSNRRQKGSLRLMMEKTMMKIRAAVKCILARNFRP